MNIKFGMNNFYVRYLKRFLDNELEQSNNILGDFNKSDLVSLVKYLNLPNVKTMFEVNKEIVKEFPELGTYFYPVLKNDEIIYNSKVISKSVADFIVKNSSKLKEYCESVGWVLSSVSEWIDSTKDINNDGVVDSKDREIIYNIIYNNGKYDEDTVKKADLNLDGKVNLEDLSIFDEYTESGKLKVKIVQSNRKNYFPNKDMLVFVNQFQGDFIYNYAIRDGLGDTIDDVPHPNNSGLYKIALYECTPGQKITIAHNNSNSVHLVIGSSQANLRQDITSFMLQNVVEVDLSPGVGYQYTCSGGDADGYDAHWLCIQCPSNYNDIGPR